MRVDSEGNRIYPLPGGAVQLVPYDADWREKVPEENISIEKFENQSGYKEFDDKAKIIEAEMEGCH